MQKIVFAALFSLVSAQNCQQNVLLDDFKSSRQAVVDNATRYVDYSGGDYGGQSITMDFSHVADSNGYLSVIPTSTADDFFFFKANAAACYDLTNFIGLQVVMSAPVGATSTFTLTQKMPDCIERDDKGDSAYVNVQDFAPFTGQPQTFFLPFKNFTSKASGNGTYDFVHFKDFTFVGMKPANAEFKFYKLEMIGNCNPPPVTTTPGSTSNSGNTANVASSGLKVTSNLMALALALKLLI